jgi:hypothetical protein
MSIMDPNSNEFLKKLAEGPFRQKGFSKQLQQRIEHKMDQQSKPFKARMPKIIIIGFVMLFLLFAIRLDLTKPEVIVKSGAKQASVAPNATTSTLQQAPIHSVLLLGLRTDLLLKDEDDKTALQDNYESTYRTLMIANDNLDHLQLSVVAKGSGILVPYGQEFWEINVQTQQTTNDMKNYFLTAYPAKTQPGKENIFNLEMPNELLNHNEKLVFAGNKYVSIEEQELVSRDNVPTSFKAVWTRELEQINAAKVKNASDKPHISLQRVLGNDQTNEAIAGIQSQKTGISGENWTIARQNGKWVPQVAEININNTNSAQGFIMYTLPLTLPESVVSHDQLVSTWEEVKQVHKDAVDAISSPDGDMIAIMTTSMLYVYPYANHQFGSLALQVALNNNESLVMAQWASAKYADKWIEEGKRFLTN